MLKGNKPRAANQADDEGVAVFCVADDRSRAYDTGTPLPARAVVAEDIDLEGECLRAGSVVSIVQAEIVDERDVIVGFKYKGFTGVCSLAQLKLTPTDVEGAGEGD